MPQTPQWIARLDTSLTRAETALTPYQSANLAQRVEDLLTDLLVLAEVHKLNIDATWEQATVRADALVGDAIIG